MDRERSMLTAKILTDLRYAFKHDVEQEPYGAVVMHTLKLSYHEEGEHREFLLALDDEDIRSLRSILQIELRPRPAFLEKNSIKRVLTT